MGPRAPTIIIYNELGQKVPLNGARELEKVFPVNVRNFPGIHRAGVRYDPLFRTGESAGSMSFLTRTDRVQ